MFYIQGNNIEMTRGDTLHAVINMRDPLGVISYPETGDVVTFNAMLTRDGEAVITKTIPHDTMTLTLDPEDTEELAYGRYIFTVRITRANGDVDTFIDDGTLTLVKTWRHKPHDAYVPWNPWIPLNSMNGWLAPGGAAPVDAALNISSDHPVQNKVLYQALDGKVDKVTGKGLSTNDFTTEYMQKLDSIETGANRTVVDALFISGSTNPVQSKTIQAALNAKADAADVTEALANKVDKVYGKVLSSNDFTDVEKAKLANIASGADKTVVDDTLKSDSVNPVQNRVIHNALALKVDKISGKGLSTNDFTDELAQKLTNIAELKCEKVVNLIHLARNESTGLISIGISSAPYHYTTGGFLDVRGASKVVVTANLTDGLSGVDGLRVYLYDENFGYLSLRRSYDGEVSVDTSNAAYIIPMIEDHVSTEVDTQIIVTAFGVADIPEVRNAAQELGEDGFMKFNYEVMPGVYNTGRIMLPPNYDPFGTSVPVIVYVHGSSAYLNSGGSPMIKSGSTYVYKPYFEYLRDCGYAIVSCWGWTTKNESAKGFDNPWPVPTTIKAYEMAVEFATTYFNLDRRNMFVMCKSLGGYVAQVLLSSGAYRCGCFLAPAMAFLGGDKNTTTDFGYASQTRTVIAEELGFKGDVEGYISGSFSAVEGEDDPKAYFFRQNLDKLGGFMVSWRGVVGNTASQKLENDLANRHDKYDLCRVGTAPLKIWVAPDDTVIRPVVCEEIVRQIQNAGQKAELRWMPEGTGGHHSTDTDAAAPKVDSVTTSLGITHNSVPLAYVEVTEFLERYRTTPTGEKGR